MLSQHLGEKCHKLFLVGVMSHPLITAISKEKLYLQIMEICINI